MAAEPTPPASLPGVQRLLATIARLRAPDGCPWDRKQTLATLWPYLREELEEAAEACAAAEAGRLEPDEVREELGDLLFNVVFVSELCRERGWFSMADIVEGAETKIRRRHPHIFGALEARTPEEVERIWAAVKTEEKAEKERKRARRAASTTASTTASGDDAPQPPSSLT